MKLDLFQFRVYRGLGDSFAFVAKKEEGQKIADRIIKESKHPHRVTVSCNRLQPTTYKKFFSKT